MAKRLSRTGKSACICLDRETTQLIEQIFLILTRTFFVQEAREVEYDFERDEHIFTGLGLFPRQVAIV